MRQLSLAALCLAALVTSASAQAPAPGPLQILPPTISQDLRIVWEVKNRFRLFRREQDFLRHVAALNLKTVLAAEQQLAGETDGRGWAAPLLSYLCVDTMGALMTTCERDGQRESYLAPTDYRVEMRLVGAPPQTTCAWVFDEGDGQPRSYNGPCGEEVRIRLGAGKPTTVTVDAAVPDGPAQRATTEIVVRDLLIAGLGDSVAAGEGNPDRPVALSDEGFCFRRFITGAHAEYYRPGRAGFKGDRTCEGGRGASDLAEWSALGARWLGQACHRSLYGYQLRTALALAVENPHVAVTFLPLACTGASIDNGVLSSQRARELNCTTNRPCPSTVPAQVTQLQQYLTAARRGRPDRMLDLVLLTVGANDIDFSGLVANAIIDATTERTLVGRVIQSVEGAEGVLRSNLPANFGKLRSALRPMVGGDLSRVVFVSYGHPALRADGAPCAGGQAGFDVHPAFKLDGERLRQISNFTSARFLPQLKAIAQCVAGSGCANPADRMTFVDAHQQAFAGHGVCARSEQDPEFDRACFSAEGKSFAASPVEGATEPLTCGRPVAEFRAYSPRARWIRTANDSYFVAMTYPEGLPSTQQPTDLHDATWGIISAVYGGAVHPTAEGHAAMADAALASARRVLGLAAQASIASEPLPPPGPLPQ